MCSIPGTETLLLQLFNITSNATNLLHHIATMLPPTHSLDLAWLPGLGLPRFLLLICPLQTVPTITHTSFPPVITWGLNYSTHTYTTLWAHATLHIHKWIMVSLFFLPRLHWQAGWPRPLMLETPILYTKIVTNYKNIQLILLDVVTFYTITLQKLNLFYWHNKKSRFREFSEKNTYRE